MLHVGKGRSFGHVNRMPAGIASVGALSAPSIGYPSPLASNPTTIAVSIPADWQSGDVLKLARSASLAMTSPAILTHTITDADITAGTFSIGLSGVTLSGITYFQAYGARSGVDSTSKSNIVTWGDSTAPTITTAATASITETSQLAVALTGTDTGGIASWAIVGGADQLCFEVSGSTLRWLGNGSQSYSAPVDAGGDNVYDVVVQATDYGGNTSTLAIAVTVTQIDATPDAFTFTNVGNATLSTVYTSNTITLAGLAVGFNIPASLSGTGFTYSKNGGAYQAAGSFTVQNGDTLTLRDTSPAANNLSNTATVTVGTYSTGWTVATPVTTTSWNPADTNASTTLSNSNLTATHDGTTNTSAARSLNSFSTGKRAVRFAPTTAAAWAVGIASASEPLNNFPGTGSCVYWSDTSGNLAVANVNVAALGQWAIGDTLDMAFDFDAQKVWVRRNGSWLGTGGDPNASGPGYSISTVTGSPFFIYTLSGTAGSVVTLQAVSIANFTSVI